jgi:hypothetical protein
VECHGLTARIDELGRDLTNYRDQLAAKSDELTVALALPKDDPQLRGKLHDLENANAVLRGQIDSVNLESNLAKESAQSLQEASAQFQDQIRELQDKLSITQDLVKRAAQEKNTYTAASKEDVDKAKQEVAKAANAAANEARMRHEAMVKNFDQRRNETESQLKVAKEGLQKSKEENTNYANHINELKAEMAGCKEKLDQQAAQIKDLEVQNPSREHFDTRDQSMESARGELAEFKVNLQAAKNEAAEKLDEVRRSQREAEDHLQVVDRLQREKEELQCQFTNLQNKYDTLRSSATRHLTRTGDMEHGGSVDAWATTVPLHTPPKMPPPAFPLQRASGPQPSPNVSSNSDASTTVVVAEYLTPQETLQKALDRRSGIFGNLTAQSTQDTVIQNPTPAATNSQHRSISRRGSSSVNVVDAATIQSTPESDVYAMVETTPKTLRPANRRGSNFTHHEDTRARVPSRTRSTNGRRSAEIRHSTVTRTTHRTEETTYSVKAPANGNNPFSGMAPVGPHTSSSLTDVEPIFELLDSISNQDDLQSAYRRTRETKNGEASSGRAPIDQGYIMDATSKQPRSASMNRARDRSHFSDNELAVEHPKQKPASGNRDNAAAGTAANSKRREEQVLKSVLKKTGRVELSNVGIPLSAPLATANPARVMKNKPSGLGVNKRMAGPETMGGISDYNRVVSGVSKKAVQNIDNRGFNPTLTNRQSNELSHKSPLLPAPRRNTQKRKASDTSVEDREHRPKGTKSILPTADIQKGYSRFTREPISLLRNCIRPFRNQHREPTTHILASKEG